MMKFLLNRLGRTPLSRRRALWGLALVAPNVIGLMVFFGLPILSAFATSLNEWNGIKPPTAAGFSNFERLFSDPAFWQAVGNTFRLLIFAIPAGFVFSLSAAVLLNQRLRGRGLFRTIYFLPVVTSTVAASIVWTWIFQPRYGLVGNLFAGLGLLDTNWLTRPDLVLIPIGIVMVWQRLGFDMVLFLAGLQAIPRRLQEAAVIDGANRWQRFRHVTLPLLSPTIFLVLVLSTISAFQVFDQVYVMTARVTRGGVGGSATTLSYFLYESGFSRSEFGYASAIALVLFVVILVFTVFQLRLQRLWVYYEAETGA